MVLSTQTAIWSPAAGPFMRMQSPWVLQKSLAKLSGLKVLLGPAAKAGLSASKLASQTLCEKLQEITAL